MCFSRCINTRKKNYQNHNKIQPSYVSCTIFCFLFFSSKIKQEKKRRKKKRRKKEKERSQAKGDKQTIACMYILNCRFLTLCTNCMHVFIYLSCIVYKCKKRCSLRKKTFSSSFFEYFYMYFDNNFFFTKQKQCNYAPVFFLSHSFFKICVYTSGTSFLHTYKIFFSSLVSSLTSTLQIKSIIKPVFFFVSCTYTYGYRKDRV